MIYGYHLGAGKVRLELQDFGEFQDTLSKLLELEQDLSPLDWLKYLPEIFFPLDLKGNLTKKASKKWNSLWTSVSQYLDKQMHLCLQASNF